MFQGDLFGGLNDGLLSRAEALAAVDMGKHPANGTPGLPQLKHDMMYHHGMGGHPGTPNSRAHQVSYSSQCACIGRGGEPRWRGVHYTPSKNLEIRGKM